MPLLETKGAASAQGFGEFAKVGAVNYIEDVFSTYLYTGNGATQSINNGIDLSTKGGLVWVKVRDDAYSHALVNTIQGGTGQVSSNSTAAQAGAANDWDSFTTTGFNVKAPNFDYLYNQNTRKYVSWAFRKQAKFFDVVTYTGNGVARTISHNLGSVPGCIIIKDTSASRNWNVYHRSTGNTQRLLLNDTTAAISGTTEWNSTTPTATAFTVGTSAQVNQNGFTYVAYLFAHDAGGFGLTGTDNVISCGSYTGNGSTSGPSITLGYEPQWIMIKNASSTGNWVMQDVMRGMPVGGNTMTLFADLSNAEVDPGNSRVQPTATGFQIANTTSASLNTSGNTYIYIAIRRGPMKVPTSGTSVFSPQIAAGVQTTNFPVDAFIGVSTRASPAVYDPNTRSRLIGAPYLVTSSTAAETGTTSVGFDSNTGLTYSWPSGGVNWYFQRAPGFFDVVCFTASLAVSNNQRIPHSLGVVPELVIFKSRSAPDLWIVWNTGFASNQYLRLNGTAGIATQGNTWPTPMATATDIGIRPDGTGLWTNGATYVAYLFATCPGVSKVGSYTGTGALQTVNCGFTGGARFVLIKRTDSTGDWYVYDSARGITSGNDPYLFLNSTAAEVTGTNYVDTTSVGFQVTAAAPAGLNANGGTYIFLAIA